MILDQRELTLVVSAVLTIILCLRPRFLRYVTAQVPVLRLTIAAILVYTAAGVIVRLAFPKEIVLW